MNDPNRPSIAEEWMATLDEMSERIKELEAIVDNLPKTEDGVVVTPGMELWSEVGHIGGIGMGWAIMAEVDEEEAPGDAVMGGYWASSDALKEHIAERNQPSKETQ